MFDKLNASSESPLYLLRVYRYLISYFEMAGTITHLVGIVLETKWSSLGHFPQHFNVAAVLVCGRVNRRIGTRVHADPAMGIHRLPGPSLSQARLWSWT